MPTVVSDGGRAEVVAIIMDGNSRWADARGLATAEGHREGTKALRRTVESALELGIRTLVVYAFSTENWARPEAEVGDLMEIFAATMERELPEMARKGVHIRFLGRRDRAPGEIRERMDKMEADTAAKDRLDLWIAFDYGGRAELVDAAKRLLVERVPPDELDDDLFASYLYAPALPDPDVLIRTAGDMRISNFLLWQLAYSELVFVDTLWPDFGEADLRAALDEYARRERRFGGR